LKSFETFHRNLSVENPIHAEKFWDENFSRNLECWKSYTCWKVFTR